MAAQRNGGAAHGGSVGSIKMTAGGECGESWRRASPGTAARLAISGVAANNMANSMAHQRINGWRRKISEIRRNIVATMRRKLSQRQCSQISMSKAKRNAQ